MANVSIRLRSDDWFYVPGRGSIATFDKKEWPFDPLDLNGQKVIIDDKCFTVTDVEKFALAWYPGKEEFVGLRVRAEDDQPTNDHPFTGARGSNTYTSVMQKAGKLPLICDRQTNDRGCNKEYNHKGAHHDPTTKLDWT